MTVEYINDLATASFLGSFLSVLFRWRGSVFKLVWIDLAVYLLLYYILNITLRYTLMNSDDAQNAFQKWQKYVSEASKNIPLFFVLGFYVSMVVSRWWAQVRLIPFPDTLAVLVSAAISPPQPADYDKGRLMRRTVVRYFSLALIMTLMKISLRARKRFPSYQHVVDAGLMLESEKKILEQLDKKDPMSKQWLPLRWAANIVTEARREGLIRADCLLPAILNELSAIRDKLVGIINHDGVPVPLVYTQVVAIAVYVYFLATLIREQMLPGVDNGRTLNFPTFTVLEFIFYMGWLKTAEVLLNPFGEDDDDIEVNWIIDRHIKVSYTIADETHEEYPEMLQDRYWDEVVPSNLPYTIASGHDRRHQPKGSAEHFKVRDEDARYDMSDHNNRNMRATLPAIAEDVTAEDLTAEDVTTDYV